MVVTSNNIIYGIKKTLYYIPLSHSDSESGIKNKNKKTKLLGSKDLGSYVFRTLMCIVGKP